MSFFLQARQLLIFGRLRRRQCAQEIAKIVGERMKLKPIGDAGERPADSRPTRAVETRPERHPQCSPAGFGHALGLATIQDHSVADAYI